MDIKRMNYFKGEFLNKDDFEAEQKYHIDTLTNHNKNLHTWGIAGGLDVPKKTGVAKVTVKSGMAIDSDGRQIILVADVENIDIPSNSGKTIFYLTISYHDEPSDPREDNPGKQESTRITEKPNFLFEKNVTDPSMHIILAKITLVDNTISEIDLIERKRAGSVVGDLLANSITLSIDNPDASKWPKIKGIGGTTPGIEITGDIRGNLGPNMVDTNQIVNNAVTVDKIVNGAVTIDKLATPVKAAINSSLPLTGGTLSGNLQVNGNIGTSGTVDGRDVSADGAKLDVHVANNNNPHNTTAEQVDALSLKGGTLSGNLSIKDGDLNIKNSLTVMCEKGAGWYGGFFWHGNPNASGGILAIAAPTLDSYPTTPVKAAVSALSGITGVNGVYAYAPKGTPALNVNGVAEFSDTVYFRNGKSGFVIDTFVNRSGMALRTGDVVKLKGSPISRFYGENNKIPVAEVTLADKEDDHMIIGIVDMESMPEPGSPDARTSPDDPTVIEDGGDLFVVTLGAYSHCKVDASEAPIEVGDLLTSSSNPGHAKKAMDPKVGSIIGKALEPLKEGTGYIAVFVNIQ